jgi:CBS domain-containing protein
MLVGEIMSKEVETVYPNTTIKDIAKKMLQRDCGCVVVVEDDRLIGMITDRDIALRCFASDHDPAGTDARKIMTSDILYCKDTDHVDDVTRNMMANKVRRLPVLNVHKRLVGIISLGDIASHSNHLLCGQALGEICKAA